MEFAVTVIGSDRTGIVADVSEALASLGANLTDSAMTRLRGHFAMTLICTVAASADVVESTLRPLTAEGRLSLSVREITAGDSESDGGRPYILSLHGADRLGIVSSVTRVLAGAGGNITDLSTRLLGPLYVLVAEVELPVAEVEALQPRLAELAEALGVEITLRPAETDIL